MKRLNSPAILAILAAFIMYIGVLGTMYAVSVYRGHNLVQERTRTLMHSIALNIEEVLFTMGNTSTGYLSSWGAIERDKNYTRLIITEKEKNAFTTEEMSNSIVHFVQAGSCVSGAFFCFEPGVFCEDSFQPFCHIGDTTASKVYEHFQFYDSYLYNEVKKRHTNWWHTSKHLTSYGEAVMSCCTPIYLNDTSHFIGAFVMDYSLDSLNSIMNAIKPYEEAELFIINSLGYVIAQTDTLYYGYYEQDLPIWNKKEYGNEEVEFPYLPWKLRMYTPKELVQNTLISFLNYFILYGFVGLLLIALCLVYAIRAIQKSLKKQNAIENELRMAGHIQRTLLPQDLPQCTNVNCSAFLRPAKDVAGDVYEVQQIGQYIYFMIGDVSGKGLQASMLMAMMNGLFRHEVRRNNLPSDVMKEINQAFVERNPEMLFCTMLIGRIDTESGELRICNAGHNCPILRGQFMSLNPHIALGIVSEVAYQDDIFWLRQGDSILCYTDGVTEAMTKRHQLFGEERLLQLPPKIEEIVQAIDTFVNGAKQNDDITLLCLEFSSFVAHSIEDTSALRDYLSKQYKLGGKELGAIELPLEEAIVNSLTHGQSTWVNTILEVKEGKVQTAEIIDNGIAYDPTQYKDTTDTDRIGGQGILLIRQMTQQVLYRRVGERNHLILKFNA